MSTQTVFFNNPQSIVQLQTQVASLTGSVTSLNSQVVSLSGSVSSLQVADQLLTLRTQNTVPSVLDIFEEHKQVTNMAELSGPGVRTTAGYMMENMNIFTVSTRNPSFTGTELWPGDAYRVYGYTGITGSSGPIFTFTGGVSYRPSFTGINMQIHTPNEAETFSASYYTLRACAEPNVAYYIQRGYAMPPPDLQADWINVFAQTANPIMIAIELVVPTGTANITAVNLCARKRVSGTIENNLQKDPSNLNNFKHRTCQIPVTTSFSTYLTNKNNNTPTAFWDQSTKQITISYPPAATAYTFYATNVSFPQYNFFTDLVEKLTSFEGTFGMYKRDRLQKLTLTNAPSEVECLLQVSPTLTYTNRMETSTGSLVGTSTFNNPFMAPSNQKFTGFWIPKLGQGNANFDIYSVQPGIANGNAAIVQPIIAPACSLCGTSEGDNSTSEIIEYTAAPSSFKVWDTSDFNTTERYINPTYWGNPTPYEEMTGTFTGNELVSPAPPEVVMQSTFAHELFHNIQIGQGSSRAVDAEGQATALEMDERLCLGEFFTLRAYAWYTYLLPLFRGDYCIGQKQSVVSPPVSIYDTLPTVSYPDYGTSVWYTYVRGVLDKNFQMVRRINELCAIKYFSNVLKENGLEYTTGIMRSPNACKLATRDAVQDLFGQNIADVFTNYSVAVCLLRANSSIPEQYRMNFPFWYWSKENPFNKTINSLGTYGDSWWWGDFDKGLPINHNQTNGAVATGAYFVFRPGQTSLGGTRRMALTDETIIPTWPKVTSTGSLNYKASFVGPYATGANTVTRRLEDLAMCAFILPNALNSIDVTVATGSSGACRVSVFKFSPDNTSTGSFVINGPISLTAGVTQTFDLTSFQSLPGITKISVANTSVRDYGSVGNCYLPVTGPIPYTATVTFAAL